MNAEQIRQNAEEYAINGNTRGSLSLEILFQNTRDAFIAGAHSRDEEVKQWKESKRKLRLRLMQRIHELRRPWISVEDRLPEEGRKYKGYSDEYLVRVESLTGIYYDKSEYDLNNNSWLIEGFSHHHVTHWMPIPELPKGE